MIVEFTSDFTPLLACFVIAGNIPLPKYLNADKLRGL